ncbi:hypothetical protein MASR1M8_10040 [Thermomonas brevis]
MSRITIPLLLAVALAACNAPQAPEPASPPAPAAEPAPTVPSPTPEPAPAPAADTGFAPAPAVGRVIRANCRMGGCWWYRYEAVQAEQAMPPHYALQLRIGDSGPHPDPYPEQAEGVDIRWDAEPTAARVACSKDAPAASAGGDEMRLRLNPQGVSGVEQGLASLYFATCHGEVGDDAKLADKYGYDVR